MPKKSNTPPMGFFSAFNDPKRNTRARKPRLGQPTLGNPSGYGYFENRAAQEALNRKLDSARGGSPSPLKKKRDKKGRFIKADA